MKAEPRPSVRDVLEPGKPAIAHIERACSIALKLSQPGLAEQVARLAVDPDDLLFQQRVDLPI